MKLSVVETQPQTPAVASVICLHGLGADGRDLMDLESRLDLPATRFIFPDAPVRPVTLNGGSAMRAWFDVFGLDRNARTDAHGIRQAQRAIDSLIGRELARGIPSQHIVLLGFSQGAAMALQCGLRYPVRLGGVVALSGLLPLADALPAEASAANLDLPIFMAHGANDLVIDIQLAERARNALTALGYPLTWRTYPMTHQIIPEEIGDIQRWLHDLSIPPRHTV